MPSAPDPVPSTRYDLLVIGGGIHGLFAAYDAAQRGLTVALVDRADFGSGLTFNHQRTIHGGLRSLGSGQIGKTRRQIDVSQHVRCARDARGNVDRLVPVRLRDYPQRRGLALTLRGPSSVQAGAMARYRVSVRNLRRGTSLWDLTVRSGRQHRRLHEVRRRHIRTVTFTRRVPRAASGRFCVSASEPSYLAPRDMPRCNTPKPVALATIACSQLILVPSAKEVTIAVF